MKSCQGQHLIPKFRKWFLELCHLSEDFSLPIDGTADGAVIFDAGEREARFAGEASGAAEAN